jgi:hypothetical protein
MDAIREQAAQLQERWKAVNDAILANPTVAAPYLQNISAQ